MSDFRVTGEVVTDVPMPAHRYEPVPDEDWGFLADLHTVGASVFIEWTNPADEPTSNYRYSHYNTWVRSMQMRIGQAGHYLSPPRRFTARAEGNGLRVWRIA